MLIGMICVFIALADVLGASVLARALPALMVKTFPDYIMIVCWSFWIGSKGNQWRDHRIFGVRWDRAAQSAPKS